MNPIVKLLLGYVAKVYKIQEDEAAALLFQTNAEDATKFDYDKIKDDALSSLLSKDAARVVELKKVDLDKTEVYEKAYNKAKKEILPQVEKKLAKKYGIDGDTPKMEDLVEAIVKKQLEESGQDIDDIKVKTHPAFLAREKELKAEIQQLKSEHEKALEAKVADLQRIEDWNATQPLISSMFDGLNPVLSEDTKRATNQKLDFIEQFKTVKTKKDGDKHLVLKEDGSRLEDDHGNPVYLSDLVEQKASRTFDFAKQSDKGGAGNEGNAGGGKVDVPGSEDEYNRAILEAKTAEERAEIQEAYEAANSGS